MKLRNLLFIVVIVSFVFSSCNRDNATSIVGTWKYDRVEVANNLALTGLLNGFIQERLGDSDITAIFREDGTYTIAEEGEINSGTWSLENRKLIVDGQEIEHTLSRNRLSLHTPTWLLDQFGGLLEMIDITNLNLSVHFDRQ